MLALSAVLAIALVDWNVFVFTTLSARSSAPMNNSSLFSRSWDDSADRMKLFRPPERSTMTTCGKPIPDSLQLRGHGKEQRDLEKRYGSPFCFDVGSDPSYPPIPYGVPIEVVHHPDYPSLSGKEVLVLMLTQPQHMERRRTIREHYRAFERRFNVSLLFVMAVDKDWDMKEECETFHDILQLRHPDSYHTLSLTVLHAFHVLHTNDIAFHYLVKTDDDCVLNLPLLASLLSSPSLLRLSYVYMGNCYRYGAYNTVNRTKTFVPASVVRSDSVIPTYATGGAYVLSRPLLVPLLLEARHLPFLTHQEDVTVGRAVGRAGAGCISPKPGMWIARNGCEGAMCSSYVVLHTSGEKEELERVYAVFQWSVCSRVFGSKNRQNPIASSGVTILLAEVESVVSKCRTIQNSISKRSTSPRWNWRRTLPITLLEEML